MQCVTETKDAESQVDERVLHDKQVQCDRSVYVGSDGEDEEEDMEYDADVSDNVEFHDM